MTYKLLFLKESVEEFKRLDKAVQRIIKEKLELLAQNPQALRNNIVCKIAKNLKLCFK